MCVCVCVCLHFIRQLIPFTSSIDIELQAAQLIGPFWQELHKEKAVRKGGNEAYTILIKIWSVYNASANAYTIYVYNI